VALDRVYPLCFKKINENICTVNTGIKRIYSMHSCSSKTAYWRPNVSSRSKLVPDNNHSQKSEICVIENVIVNLLHLLRRKETAMHGHDHHNTTLLSIIYNMSTTYFGQHYFWPSSGWIQLSEKITQYIVRYSITISVGLSYYILCSCLRQLYPTWWWP